MVREPHQGCFPCAQPRHRTRRANTWPSSTTTSASTPSVAAYIRFFDTHPDAVAAGGASYPSISGREAGVDVALRGAPVANPLDLGDRVRLFPAGRIPGAAIWPCAARPWSATVASTRRWAAWAGV